MITARLLCAKSKVAPVKPVSIPRLELCGAVVGARLYKKIISSLRLTFNNVYFWSDSTVVLGWLKMSPSQLKPFVQNRVVEVNELTGDKVWLHVNGKQNPADLLSRGMQLDVLNSSDLWWRGPPFLHVHGMEETQENNKMHIKPMLAIPICLFGVFVFWITGSNGVAIPNLTDQCYSCLCNVSTQCTLDHKCTAGYCGPFNISRVYWADAGRVVLPDDDPTKPNAWSNCAEDYECAKKIIEGYLQKYGKDCNNDGVTDCYDYMMVNGNGGYDCGAPLNRSVNGRRWLKRYEDCIL